MNNNLGAIHSIESFGSVDGPGVRFVVFLQGCRMRCQFCHNADTWQTKEGDVKPAALLAKAKRYQTYWRDQGGITVSGGEPLLQIDFVTELFRLAKAEGIHTTLDTCGQPFTREGAMFAKIEALMAVTDLVLLDIKHIDEKAHTRLTRWSNRNILDFAKYLDEIGKPVWIRHVLVPTINDEDRYLIALDRFVSSLSNVERVEVLPYHTMGAYKWKALGMDYPLEGVEPPTPARIANANRLLHTGKETD